MKWYAIIVMFLLIACSKKVHKASSESSSKTDSTYNSSLTVSHTKKIIAQRITRLGDTLKGSVHITGLISVDSFESAGIKIKASSIKTEAGYKTQFEAVAKPVETTETKTAEEHTNYTAADSGQAKKETAKKASERNTSGKGSDATGLIITIAFMVFAVLFVIYILKRKM